MADSDLEILQVSFNSKQPLEYRVIDHKVEDDSSEVCEILDSDGEELIVLDSVDENGADESFSSNEASHQNDDFSQTQDQRKIEQIKERLNQLEQQVATYRAENSKLKEDLSKVIKLKVRNDIHHGFCVDINDGEFRLKYGASIENYIKSLVQLGNEASDSRNYSIDKFNKASDESDEPASWSSPEYDNLFSGPRLGEIENLDAKGNKEKKKKSLSCFNCSGEHNLNECRERLDYRKIDENHREFKNSRPKNAAFGSKRYHLLNNEYHDLKPGEISEDLREALSLRRDQLPPYIYKMRLLGYPPGWLKEAEIETSGINIYDSEGKPVVKDGESESRTPSVRYDTSLLIDYPGCTSKVPQGFKEEHEKFEMPELQTNQLKSEMEKWMNNPSHSNRKRKHDSSNHDRNSGSSRKRKVPEVVIIDMELGGSDGSDNEECRISLSSPQLVQESPFQPPPLPLSTDSQEETGSKSESEYLSLTDLEEQKIKLLAELGEGDTVQSGIGNFTMINSAGDGKDITPKTLPKTLIRSESLPQTQLLISTPPNNNQSVHSVMGTAVPGQFISPYNKLPDSCSFSKGVAQHIPYENLPNATGTYSKMRSVLRKVREKVQSR